MTGRDVSDEVGALLDAVADCPRCVVHAEALADAILDTGLAVQP